MKCSYENGAKKVYVEYPSATKIFLKFETLLVKTFQIAKVNTDKTSVTRVIPKNHSLLNFRATNAVLDPDRAQPF